MSYSNRAVILAEDRFFANRVEEELRRNDVLPADNPLLVSYEKLKAAVKQAGSLNPLRDALAQEIRANGPPLVMPYHLKLFDASGEDKSAAFVTVFLTYLILSFSRDLEDIHANILFPFRSYEEELFRMLKSDYRYLLNGVPQQEGRAGERITSFRNDKAVFDRLFTIDFLNAEMEQTPFAAKMGLFLKGVEKRRAFEVKKKNESPAALQQAASVVDEPHVYFYSERISAADGEECPRESIPGSVAPGQITVTGTWGTRNLLDVNDLLIQTVGLLLERKLLNYTQELRIHLPDECVIDGAVASSAANLMMKLFGRFKASYLVVSRANHDILKRSPGHALIRSHLLLADSLTRSS